MFAPQITHAAFDAGTLPRHVASAVWRGTDLGSSVARTVSTGFPELDGELPGGGWPTHSLTELLMPQAALCEWCLLARALPQMTASGGRIYLISPPKEPHAAGLAQLGLASEQVIWIQALTPVDRLWVTEQIVKSDPSGAVLSWIPQARPEQLRRLQVHAQSCDCPVMLFRPATSHGEASPAPLRVSVALAGGWGLEIRIPKRRGATHDSPLLLDAMPVNLVPVVPPRLQVLQPLLLAPHFREDTTDARALGRVAPTSTAVQPQSH